MDMHNLSSKHIINYIHEKKQLTEILGSKNINVEEIGDGNINYVFLVKSQKSSIIIKKSVPYLRFAGESWRLSSNRIKFEISALEKFHQLMPQHVPTIYYKDTKNYLVAMEYLDGYMVMRKGLMRLNIYENFSEHISDFLANTLFKTSSYYLSSTEKRKLENTFNKNHDLCKLTEDVVFTFPLIDHPSNNISKNLNDEAEKIRTNICFKEKILDLKYCFINQRDALVHGDLHTGSIMLNNSKTYVIDPEFAFVGPFGFDVGALLANLIMSYVVHKHYGHEQYTDWILTMIQDFLHKFYAKFLSLWRSQQNSAVIVNNYLGENELENYRRKKMIKIFQQSLGFAGCKMVRRIFGIAGIPEIRDIVDKKLRLQVEKLVLVIATKLVEEHDRMDQVEDLINLIRNSIVFG